jgi:hypothetical protein
MIKFGMSLPAIFNQLRKGYIKVRGTEPKGLDLIKIKQEAMQKFEDMRKVLDMQGNPIDPSKPIMGGTQMGQRGIFDNIFNRMQSQMGKKPNVVKSDAEIKAALEKSNKDSLKNLKDKIDDPDKKADGGRIGLKEGEGIMQMASVDEPFFRDDYLDENAQMMFKKQYKDLTPDELEEFREEMMRLMNKFSSAPDPMDERNTVMENIARQEFGKPLKDLSEDEIIQIEEMMDEMSVKPNRGAQSIKLAEGGRIGLKDGMLAKMMSGVKPDGGIFKSLFANRNAPILSGLNTAELFDLVTTLSNLPGLAEGGRIGYKDGPKDPGKRKFIKAAVGIASMIPGMSMIGKGAKVAAPVVAKAAEISGPALAKIVETVMDLGKLISVKGRRVKEMVTKKKHQGVEVTEDIADQSYVIKKDNKEIYYKPGRMDETGGVEDDIIEILEDRIKKAGGGLSYMLGE